MIGKGSNFIGYIILSSFLFWFLLLFFHHSDLINFNTQVSLSRIHFLDTYESYSVQTDQNEIKQTPRDVTFNVAPIPSNDTKALTTENSQKSNTSVEKQPGVSNVDSDYELCSGRYIYVHNLPLRYNLDLIRHCDSLSEWTNMCIFFKNFGFGPPLRDAIFRSSSLGWFHTNQFMLEVIFHNRIKAYKCLTNDSSLASAIFVPYYAGLDVAKYLWDLNPQMKDYNPNNLTKWLREQPEWKRLGGRDHFLVAGRITWDFRRQNDDPSDWGNKLMILPESKNMTILTIESSPWHRNDFAVPYPSYFHPSTDKEVYRWQNRMKKIKRRYLFSFVGGPRPNKNTIRGMIIHQCLLAGKHCKLLECENKPNKCDKPVNVMKFFQSSTFCLQPQGDSYTRRSTFDSILAGCIPVFFHPGSAYVQYLWHFPKDYTKYSVFIPEEEVRNGKTSIERILNGIPKQKRIAMREQVIKLIPGVVYAYPNNSMDLKDAFDISVDGVIERIEGIRKEIGEGKNVDENEEVSWKKYLFGTTGEHEWDHFFRVQ